MIEIYNNLPNDFKWGASTSAYQIEGSPEVDGKGQSIWDANCKNKDYSEVTCDHYNRYKEDVQLMKNLNLDVYRFSINWSRILPNGKGKVNQKGLDFYDKLIEELLKNDIEPWICGSHWDFSQPLQNLGGWSNRDSIGWFSDYINIISKRYGDRVKNWATFNEQCVSNIFGVLWGWSPPFNTNLDVYLKTVHHTNVAHGSAIEILRSNVKNSNLGVIHNIQPIYPESSKEEDVLAAEMFDCHWNEIYSLPQILGYYPELIMNDIEPYVKSGDMSIISTPMDFFGLNHYSQIYAKHNKDAPYNFGFGKYPNEVSITQNNWPISPKAFYDTLIRVSKFNLPIYITELNYSGNNEPHVDGYVDDTYRIDHLSSYFKEMNNAVKAGVDIKGFFIWSLLDNLEWGDYAPKFGIVHVDFETQKRTIKKSGFWYRDLIEQFKNNT